MDKTIEPTIANEPTVTTIVDPIAELFGDAELPESLDLEPPKTTAEKIVLEKRRRHQAYMALDYLLSAVTYFDFFSLDAFKIAKSGKYTAQIYKKKDVPSELLLLTFFNCSPAISDILEASGITEKIVIKMIDVIYGKKKETYLDKKKMYLRKVWVDFKAFWVRETLAFDQSIKFSHEVNLLFEKAAENALTRFKTPVITPEILFITMVEQKNSKASKIIKKLLKDDADEIKWYVLRYKLIKRIHYQESNLRSEVTKNQHYFAYLLKVQLPEAEFNKLIDTETLQEGVSLFRNNLISKILEVDIYDEIAKEINTSIKLTSKRRSYST
jgi:hypothetical protein